MTLTKDAIKQLKEMDVYFTSLAAAYSKSVQIVTSQPESYRKVNYHGTIVNFHNIKLSDFKNIVSFISCQYPDDVRTFWDWLSDGLYDILLVPRGKRGIEGILIPNFPAYAMSYGITKMFYHKV